MKKYRYKKLTACIVAVTLFFEMTFGSSAWMIFAETGDTDPVAVESEEAEVPSYENGVVEKGEDYTVFQDETGERTLEMYTSSVREADENGNLIDIDNTLVVKEDEPDKYVNSHGFANVVLPEEPSKDSPIEVTSGEHTFLFYPLLEPADDLESISEEYAEEELNYSEDEKQDSMEEDEPASAAEDFFAEESEDQTEEEINTSGGNDVASEKLVSDKIEIDELIEENVENLYHEEDVKPVGIRYKTPNPDVTFEYYATDSGIKEDIILQRKPESNSFSFMINCKGTVPELKYRAIVFYDEETGEETGAIQEPFMTDASGDLMDGYSEDLDYSLETVDEDEGIYKVILTVSNDYLSDPDRVYPVTIDPTYTANTSSSVQSVYVLSKHKTTNYNSSGIRKMCIGYGANDGICRTYVHFPNLIAKIKGKYINSATFKLTEYQNTHKNTAFGIYRVKSSWKNSTLTYNNQPTYIGTAVASGKIKGTSNAKQVLNITSLVQGWASETYASNGLLIKAKTESSSNKNFSSFFNAYYGTASKRPVLSVTYTVPSPPVPAQPSSMLLNNKSPLYARKTDTVKMSWVGAKSNILKGTQWRLVKYTAANTYDTATVIQEYTNTCVNAASGTFTIPSAKMKTLSDGKYNALIRGVDKLGNKGVGKGCFMYIDGTAPVLQNVSLDHTSTQEEPSDCITPTVSWTASDAVALASVSVLLDGTILYSSSQSGAGTYAFEEGDFQGTGNHQIVVRAADKAGNITSSDVITYYTNLDTPTISNVQIDTQTSDTEFSNNRQPVITFSIESDNLDHCNVKLGESALYTSEQTGSHRIVMPAITGIIDGCNAFVIEAVSTTGISSSRKIKYYFDGTVPVFNSISTTPDTGIFNRSSNTSPQINWDVSDPIFKRISYSTDGENYCEMSSDAVGNYVLPPDTFTSSGRHVISIQAEDLAGNISERNLVYYLSLGDETDQDYVPQITDIQEYYGKRIIRYSANIDDFTVAYWNLYRRPAVDENQGGSSTSDEVLVRGHVAGNMFIDKEILPEGEYEYRMEAVFTDSSKQAISGNVFSYTNEISPAIFSSSSGSKSYMGLFDFATPNGIGRVEASKGAVRYAQQDYELENDKLTYGLKRTYSSLSGMRGMLGRGWFDSYHQEIYTLGDDIYYMTGDGNCYRFIKDGNTYICEDTKEISLVTGTAKYVITDKDKTEYRFNLLGQITRITESSGYNIYYYYDQYGRMCRITSKQGMNGSRDLMLEYDDADMYQLDGIMLPDGTNMSYSAQDGELIKVSHSSGSSHTDYEYAYEDCVMSEVRDAEGNSYGLEYAEGKLSGIVYPDGTKDEFVYTSDSAERSYKTSSGANIYSESFEIDNSARVVSWTDRNGLTTYISYSDEEPYLPASERYTVEYESVDADGSIVFHTDSNAETVYTYNANGDMTREADDTSMTNITYGDSNNSSLVTKERTTENGTVTQNIEYTYDENGNLLTESDLVEDSETLNEYINGNVSNETVVEEGTVVSDTDYEYDDEGNVESESVTSGIVEENNVNTYDEMGRVLTESDGKTTTTYTYDYMGRVTGTSSVTQGIEGTRTTSSVYNDNGTLIQETDERGAVTTYTYDSMNRLVTSSKEGDTNTRSYTYTNSTTIDCIAMSRSYDALAKETLTDTFGHVVSETYTDPAGHIVRETTGTVTQDHIYDKSGNQVVTKLAAGGMDPQISLNLYDRNGRSTHEVILPVVSAESYAIGNDTIVSETSYSDKGEIIERKSGEGNRLYYSYDESGRITGIGESAEANDRTVTYSSDGLTSTTRDAGGKIQTEVQDGYGLTLSITDSADGCTSMQESYTYDSDGYLTKKTLPDGSEISYTNDALGRVTVEKRYEYDGEGLTQTSEVHYSYNLYGDITGTECYTANGGSLSLYYSKAIAYDNLGRKTSETVTNGSDAEQTTTWTYDAKGRVTGIDYPALADIDSVSYTYDQYDRLVAVSTGSATHDRTVTYDGFGRPAVVTDQCGQAETVTTYTYDDTGRVTDIRHSRDNSDLLSYAYAYDKDNRITSRHEVNNISGTERDETRSYTYGSYSRLTQTSVSRTIDGNTVNSQYSYIYDAAGNRISAAEPDKTTTYTFNGLNQLVSASDGIVSTAYAYDDNGNLISELSSYGSRTNYDFSPEGTLRSVSVQSGAGTYTEHMLYDAEGIRVEKAASGSFEHYYYIDGLMVLGKKNSGDSLTYLYAGNEVIRSASGDNRYYYLQDIQESTTAICSSSGSPAAVYEYTDFGETSEIVADNTGNEICYTGAVYDKETGEYYLNARYYDPETAQFLSQDTYRGNEKDYTLFNMYAYCANNPVGYKDTNGHKRINVTNKLNKLMIKNTNMALNYIKNNSRIEALKYFIRNAKTNGNWDLKNKKAWAFKSWNTYYYKNKKLRNDDPGNIHFGFVGSVFFSLPTLILGAGLYQVYSDCMKGPLKFKSIWGDDPRDTKMIKLGHKVFKKWAKNNKKKINQAWLNGFKMMAF